MIDITYMERGRGKSTLLAQKALQYKQEGDTTLVVVPTQRSIKYMRDKIGEVNLFECSIKIISFKDYVCMPIGERSMFDHILLDELSLCLGDIELATDTCEKGEYFIKIPKDIVSMETIIG